jgi:hypothetical protein
MRLLSEEMASDQITSDPATTVRNIAPVSASQTFIVPLRFPESTLAPSAANATECMGPDFACMVRISCPDATFHSFNVPSQLPETTVAPSGENATDSARIECGVCGTVSTFGRL